MVTYEAINMMFQFGIFLVTTVATTVAMIALYTKRKK